MKKIFSLFAAVLFAGSMFAAEVTVSKTVHDLFPDDANGTQEATLYSDANLSISVNPDGNNGKVYGTGTEWRLYQSNAAVITVQATDATIKTVAFEYTIKNTAILKFGDNTMESGTAVNVNAASAQFTVGNSGSANNGQVIIKGFTVVYETTGAAPAVEAPTFEPAAAGFDESVEVKLACVTEGATIYYTLDGADPTASSTKYTAPFTLTATTTVKAIAIKGDDKSAIASKTYKLIPHYDVAEVIAAAPANGTEMFVRGIVTKIEFKGKNFSQYGSACIYVSDANGAAGEFEFYNCLSIDKAKFTASDPAFDANSTEVAEFESIADGAGNEIKIGDLVEAFGKYKLYSGTHELDQNCNIVSIVPAAVASDCKWDEIAWFNTGLAETDENFNQFKVCKAGDYPNFVNIQIAPWADNNKGIYITFPSAEFTAISLDADQYKVEGAGILLFLTAFTEKETDVVITYKGDDCAFTIYNDKGTEPAAEEVELNITKGVMFTDAVEEEGWWQVRAMNDHYFITLSNAGTVAAVAGTYTAAQLDEDYSYVNDLTEEIGDEGYTDITFTEGSVTVTVAQDGKVSFVGALTGSDGKIYNINIVYTEPKPETTVNVTAEGEIEDYIESMGGFLVGALKDNVYVQVFIYSDQIAGEYTIEDLDPQYSYIQLGEDEYAEIYSATIKVVANADGSYIITADVLCYGDVLYKITVTIPGDEPTAIDNAKIADKIRKAIINGNVVIEKSNTLYNVNGAIVR